ncbi:MAG: phosphate ABC transporter permease [Chloroflexi bacterium RBG_16_56_11]|nr:MAG: phosphate ABC transporter permease [Chloroflexi bacterium RBG_16_56_11]
MEPKPSIIIKPRKGWQLINFKELIEYKDLFYFLVRRDIKVRYKQTVLGGLWAIIQPFFLMVIFSLFFGALAKVPSEGIPYPIFSYSAMIAWIYFSNTVSGASNSLVSNSSLVSKVYFPRLIVPLSPVVAFLLDFAISFIILFGMMLYFQVYPGVTVLFLPLLVIIMMLLASGVGTFLASLNAKYRDIQYTISFLLQFWMFASPVVYPVSMVPERFQIIYAINPMTGIIEGFRSVLLQTTAFPTRLILISGLVSVCIFIGGAMYFRRTERYFADVI